MKFISKNKLFRIGKNSRELIAVQVLLEGEKYFQNFATAPDECLKVHQMGKRLFLVMWWHMHQPLYKDPMTARYVLPWTFLHALKDYQNMPRKANMYDLKINFNLTPVLIDQIGDYGAEEIPQCLFLEKFMNDDDREYWKRLIKLMPHRLAARTIELLKIKDEIDKTGHTEQKTAKIASLYLLSWFPEKTGEIAEMEKKIAQSRISEEDRRALITLARNTIKKILPEYKKLRNLGKGDISFSPYYHPIIPLLIDIRSAERSAPGISLPTGVISMKDDAEDHVRMAAEKYMDVFGESPKAMWPSEGGVSEEACYLFSKYGFKLIGTDEQVLFNSIGRRDKKLIYRRYKFGDMTIIFRDRELSDLIGFSYQNWDQKKAVQDFIGRLKRILESEEDEPLVVVILDGENCWEYYPNNGEEFLTNLYAELERQRSWIKTLSLKEVLEMDDIPSHYLPRITPGSWIDGNFLKWIGHPEKNKFWEMLAEARRSIREPKDKSNLLVAEGSDWFWWQGEISKTDELSSALNALFINNLKRFQEINAQ